MSVWALVVRVCECSQRKGLGTRAWGPDDWGDGGLGDWGTGSLSTYYQQFTFLNICIYMSRETQQIVVGEVVTYYRLWFGDWRFRQEAVVQA